MKLKVVAGEVPMVVPLAVTKPEDSIKPAPRAIRKKGKTIEKGKRVWERNFHLMVGGKGSERMSWARSTVSAKMAQRTPFLPEWGESNVVTLRRIARPNEGGGKRVNVVCHRH